MKKSTMAMLIGLAAGLCFGEDAKTDERSWSWSPVGIGLAAPIQLPFVESDVYGLRLGGLFGCNHEVRGLDLGLAEVSGGSFYGLQASGLSWTEDNVYGAQISALGNVVNGRTYALQAGFVNVDWDDAYGLQLGAVNFNSYYMGVQFAGIINWNKLSSGGLELAIVNANQDEYSGWAFGALVNYSDKFRGFGCGLVNVAYEVHGLQLGLVNACDRLHGVQFGLVNLICESRLPIMVLANAWF